MYLLLLRHQTLCSYNRHIILYVLKIILEKVRGIFYYTKRLTRFSGQYEYTYIETIANVNVRGVIHIHH
jgi:hypothetical protein